MYYYDMYFYDILLSDIFLCIILLYDRLIDKLIYWEFGKLFF